MTAVAHVSQHSPVFRNYQKALFIVIPSDQCVVGLFSYLVFSEFIKPKMFIQKTKMKYHVHMQIPSGLWWQQE